MVRNEDPLPQEPRTRSNSLSAAWSFLFRGSKSNHHHNSNTSTPSSTSSTTSPPSSSTTTTTTTSTSDRGSGRLKHQTIKEEDDDEVDRALGKGITRKVLPQQRRSTSSVHSSPAGSSRTSPRIGPHKTSPTTATTTTTSTSTSTPTSSSSSTQQQPNALERIAIHNGNINHALAATMNHSMSLPATMALFHDGSSQQQQDKQEQEHVQGNRPQSSIQQKQQQQQQQQPQQPSIVPETYDESSYSKDKASSSPSRSRPPELLAHFVTPASGPSYFDITPTTTPTPSKKSSSGYTTKTPGRRSKRTPAQSISSTITNCGTTSRRVSFTNTDTASQNSSSYLDEQDVEIDENSFYIHLQKMQERYQAQQEPGWLRTQHALLQAKHRASSSISSSPSSSSHAHYQYQGQSHPHSHHSSHSHHNDHQSRGHHSSTNGASSSRSLLPGSPFLSRMNSGSSSPSGSDYSSSPSFHPHHAPMSRQSLRQTSHSTTSSYFFHQQRHQPVQPFNCFQPGNVICVPRERSLGGLIFHKSFVDTHILTPSPYYQGQYLTLDHKVVEIDRDCIKEISGFSHPRTVQILSEETVYSSSSKKPTRVLILDRPLEGDGVVFSRSFDGPIMPTIRKYSSDIAFLESFPELGRALRDFHNLCQEFENTYVYIRGFATYTLDKLRLIYDKAYNDCLGDSVKLQKLILRGVQAEQDCFAELMENVVLGKLYQKLFIHSLAPCYAHRDVEADAMIVRYHQYLFSAGGHRGLDGGTCLASSEGPLLQETLRKLGLSEKLRTMRVDHALERAAGMFRAWDQEEEPPKSAYLSTSSPAQQHQQEQQQQKRKSGLNGFFASTTSISNESSVETEQERRRRQLRESLRIIVQDDRLDQERRSGCSNSGPGSPQSDDNDDIEDEAMETGPWNTPLEKVHCIKRALDAIAAAAEDHLMNGQGMGFLQKKRSEVSVTTDDFIPLLALAIIQARMMRLGSNIFYLQRFRIHAPKSDVNFALVTFEASFEFLKSDPLGIMEADTASTSHLSSGPGSAAGDAIPPLRKSFDFDVKSPTDEPPIMPWGTPSHTGWGFSPPKKSSTFTPAFDLLPPTPESEVGGMLHSPLETSPPRLAAISRYNSDQHSQQRHARSMSMNFDDRLRKMGSVGGYGEDFGASGSSSSNGSWSRSPLLGPRFSSTGNHSPLGTGSPVGQGPSGTSTDGPTYPTAPTLGRRQSHTPQLPPVAQRHSISNGSSSSLHQYHHHSHHHHHGQAYAQAQHNHHLHRISVEQGRETMHRSTILPLQSTNNGSVTPHLVVKPQIMLPPPTTPPMSGQNTSSHHLHGHGHSQGRARPMSMIVASSSASFASSHSYTGTPTGSTLHGNSATIRSSRPYSSNHSSPATSPRLGPGMSGSYRQPAQRSNSLMSGSVPMLRANSLSSALNFSNISPAASASATTTTSSSTSAMASDTRHEKSNSEASESNEAVSPSSQSSPWLGWTSASRFRNGSVSGGGSGNGNSATSAAPSLPPLSTSPLILSESPVMAAVTTTSSAPPSRSQTPEPGSHGLNSVNASKRLSGTHHLTRIRTSPSPTTTSSISTPTTPTTFSPSSAHALLDSLAASAHLASPSSAPLANGGSDSLGALSSSSSSSSSRNSSVAGSIRSRSSTTRHQASSSVSSSNSSSAAVAPAGHVSTFTSASGSASGSTLTPASSLSSHHRHVFPKLSPSPSAPSTVFCKTTVTTAGGTSTMALNEVFDGVKKQQQRMSVETTRSLPEVPTLARLSRQTQVQQQTLAQQNGGTSSSSSFTRARSPAISMANTPFVFTDLGKGHNRKESNSANSNKSGSTSTHTIVNGNNNSNSNGNSSGNDNRFQSNSKLVKSRSSSSRPDTEQEEAKPSTPTVEKRPVEEERASSLVMSEAAAAPVDFVPAEVAPVNVVTPVEVEPLEVAPVDVTPVDVEPVDVVPTIGESVSSSSSASSPSSSGVISTSTLPVPVAMPLSISSSSVSSPSAVDGNLLVTSSRLTSSLPSLPTVQQQQQQHSHQQHPPPFQYIGRQAAPEIISLASPLTGSVVVRSSSPADTKPILGSSSYTPSYEALRYGGHHSSSSSPSIRHSMDGPRPSSSLSCYGSLNGSTSSFGTGSVDFQLQQQQQQQQRQSSPMLNHIPRLQQPSPQNHLHHHRQHSASATTGSFLSMGSSSSSFSMGTGSLNRGLGIHAFPPTGLAHDNSLCVGAGAGGRKKQQQLQLQNGRHERRVSATCDSLKPMATATTTTAMTTTSTLSSSVEDSIVIAAAAAAAASSSPSISPVQSGSLMQEKKRGEIKEGSTSSVSLSSLPPLSMKLQEQQQQQRESVHVKTDSGKYMNPHPLHLSMPLPLPLPLASNQQQKPQGPGLGFEPGTLNGTTTSKENFEISECRRRGSTTSLNSLTTSTQYSTTTTPILMQDPQLKTRMMGEFLSELAKVEGGDVLVGNGRLGVLGRR